VGAESEQNQGGITIWSLGEKLLAAIVKCGDDLRQELLVHQVLIQLQVQHTTSRGGGGNGSLCGYTYIVNKLHSLYVVCCAMCILVNKFVFLHI